MVHLLDVYMLCEFYHLHMLLILCLCMLSDRLFMHIVSRALTI